MCVTHKKRSSEDFVRPIHVDRNKQKKHAYTTFDRYQNTNIFMSGDLENCWNYFIVHVFIFVFPPAFGGFVIQLVHDRGLRTNNTTRSRLVNSCLGGDNTLIYSFLMNIRARAHNYAIKVPCIHYKSAIFFGPCIHNWSYTETKHSKSYTWQSLYEFFIITLCERIVFDFPFLLRKICKQKLTYNSCNQMLTKPLT